ncbi:MAG: hypothetical protein KF769_03700 [Parvibaculum sp.]|uniref:hypothetical protein n=1 Tax=Parvibaculum sp. TaxID=2024848 RepID=UPI001DC41104|nr:hypothetical protein [Parvibaculum sp.]MBX3490412.1 hypothetical protein [Parvibaculum sp.]MBX3495324.1 hypothetical protein [Parvibaculum sp.]MCW5728269.1 hypothetical protein [Parvibaculum sp.]
MTQVWDGDDLTGYDRSQARPVAPRADDAEAPRTSDFVIVGAGLVASVSISALGLWKLVELVIV